MPVEPLPCAIKRGIVNQSESGRATAEDIAWVEIAAQYGQQREREMFGRILNSLRAPAVPVADREHLARALYIWNGPESIQDTRAEKWDAFEDGDSLTRLHWRTEADRLLRILGGFPVATEVSLEDTDSELLEQADIRDGDIIRPPATNADVARLTRMWHSEGDRQAVLRILSALVDSPSAPVVQKQPRAWECPACGLMRPWRLVYCNGSDWSHATCAREDGTPLYTLETTDGK